MHTCVLAYVDTLARARHGDNRPWSRSSPTNRVASKAQRQRVCRWCSR